jgi:hypothetical protein
MPKKPTKTTKKGKPMAKEHDDRSRESHRGHERHEPHEHRRDEPYDDPAEHLAIENLRFKGGLPPTPELYARAREQWYRLPGSVIRPSMDPVIGDSGTDQQDPRKK